MNVFIIWGKFLFLLVVIYIFGTRASKNADVIAEKRGLARAFMGVVFIAMITSFPELFTGISAVATVDSPDIAVGEILGSCIFNLLIIAMIELAFRKRELYRLPGKINMLPMGFSIILIALLTLGLSLQLKLSIFNVGLIPLLIFILYFIFMRIIYLERNVEKGAAVYKKANIKKEAISFTICALVIIAVGWYLPVVGAELAAAMGWSHSFVGVVFLAFITSFPELVVSIAAVRMGSVEMFVGNIAGSNLFNLAIVFFIDIFYVKGAVLGSVSPGNLSTGIIAVLMSFIIFFAVARQSTYKFFKIISINAVIIILFYIITLVIIY